MDHKIPGGVENLTEHVSHTNWKFLIVMVYKEFTFHEIQEYVLPFSTNQLVLLGYSQQHEFC
jgi:hypothetical protein